MEPLRRKLKNSGRHIIKEQKLRIKENKVRKNCYLEALDRTIRRLRGRPLVMEILIYSGHNLMHDLKSNMF